MRHTCTTPADLDVQIDKTCALPTVDPVKSIWLENIYNSLILLNKNPT